MDSPDFPLYIITAAQSGAYLGALLDQLQAQHSRQERETREARGNTPWPAFDRAATRAALLARWPKLDPRHPQNRMNVQARQRAAAMRGGYDPYRSMEG